MTYDIEASIDISEFEISNEISSASPNMYQLSFIKGELPLGALVITTNTSHYFFEPVYVLTDCLYIPPQTCLYNGPHSNIGLIDNRLSFNITEITDIKCKYGDFNNEGELLLSDLANGRSTLFGVVAKTQKGTTFLEEYTAIEQAKLAIVQAEALLIQKWSNTKERIL